MPVSSNAKRGWSKVLPLLLITDGAATVSYTHLDVYKRQVLHTSSDGQKFEVAVDSLNANYSYKYLGKDKGVSVVTFIDRRDLMWHSTVISSAEREAAYVIDGLMHNDVVKSDVHSTDTHGYSEIIFAATHLLMFEFAPRIKGCLLYTSRCV